MFNRRELMKNGFGGLVGIGTCGFLEKESQENASDSLVISPEEHHKILDDFAKDFAEYTILIIKSHETLNYIINNIYILYNEYSYDTKFQSSIWGRHKLDNIMNGDRELYINTAKFSGFPNKPYSIPQILLKNCGPCYVPELIAIHILRSKYNKEKFPLTSLPKNIKQHSIYYGETIPNIKLMSYNDYCLILGKPAQ